MKKVKFLSMILRKRLKSSFFSGMIRFFPLALLASGADAAILSGIKSFMGILNGDSSTTLTLWVAMMVGLTVARFILLYLKVRVSERWLYHTGSGVTAWFLHTLQKLSPRVFHTPDGERQVEAAYEATQIFRTNGSVLFQALQAVLQLLVFLPVLLYISLPLTIFLFIFVVPLVAFLQRKIHKLGPADETLLRARSSFRDSLIHARRLFQLWSSSSERVAVTRDLSKQNKDLRNKGFATDLGKQSLSQITETVSVLAMVIVLAFCVLLIRFGWMDGSSLVLFCSAVLLSYKPVKECARALPQYRSLLSALHILDNFGALPHRSKKLQLTDTENSQFADSKDIRLKEKSFKYEGAEKPVFERITLSLPRTKPVLIRGKNGIGKSTFLRLLAGLEQWDDASVSATLSGTESNVFFVAQDLELPPRKLLVDFLKHSELLQSPLFASFLQVSKVQPLLEKQGLSGGERARVALLWSLASQSKTILLDEPFASIALEDREALLTAFLDITEKLGKWVIVVSHDALSPEMESRFSVIHFDEVFK